MAPALEYVALYFTLLLGFTTLSTTTATTTLSTTTATTTRTCPPLGEVPNGYWNYRNFKQHGYVLLICPVGYKVETFYLSSNGTASVLSTRETPDFPVVCQDDGKWSEDETNVACVPPNGCPVLVKPHPDATLSFYYDSTASVTSEVKVSVTCPVGHKLNRGLGRTVETVCLENGKWSEEGLACEPLPGPCEPLKELPNSHWELGPSPFNYKAKAKLKCLPGFKLPLSDATTFEIECKANGRWSEGPLGCEPMS